MRNGIATKWSHSTASIKLAFQRTIIAAMNHTATIHNATFIKFRNTCASTCKLRISVEDNARNSNPRLYWKLEPDANSAEGPFSEMGGEP